MQQPNPHQAVHERVFGLLARLPTDSFEGRQRLYDQLRGLFEGRYPEHTATLEKVIAEIESGKASGTVVTHTSVDAKPKNRRRGFVIPGVVLAVSVVAGAGWYVTQPRASLQDFDRGGAGYTSNLETLQPIPTQANNYLAEKVDGDNVIEFRGQSVIFTIEPIQVDPSKHYTVKARIRVTADDPSRGGAEFNVGVATFDADGKLQTSAPGTHRYAAASARILKAEDGWVDLEGEITGTGNKSHNQFRDGTKAVRLAAFFNYRSPKAVSQITSFSIEESKAQ